MVRNKQIEVAPTKELFVYIITRDIDISDAVIDLIDNSIDGAKRLRTGEREDFKGLWIDITFDSNRFTIKDNCGGIPLDLAQKYAFRFGRAKDMPATPGSVGQFGVGMKRALFKFGKRFSIKSKTTKESFELLVDVDEWLNRDSWNFTLGKTGAGATQRASGTEITVRDLGAEARTSFSDTNTFQRIVNEIKTRQQYFIERGLVIKVNGTKIDAELFSILHSVKLKPAYWEYQYYGVQESSGLLSSDVRVKVYTGLGKSSPEDAGWYIVCNGRVVLDADKSKATAWGPPLPHYHNQYAQFRGYVFFDSENASVLPWTTTKANIDENNFVYRKALDQMFEMAQPVIRFLDAVDREKEMPASERPLTKSIKQAELTSLRSEIAEKTFTYPPPPVKRRTHLQTISFKREKSKIAQLKEVYEVDRPNEVGEEAFDEAYNRYVEE